jgi:hypothetical protein
VITQHPDPSELAALGENLLTTAEAREIQDHLAECADCRGIVADLELLREGLSTLYPVEPMPADIAVRIDAALAAEAPRTVSRETADHDRQPGHGRHGRRRSRPQFALAAAGALVALAVGGLLAQQLQSDNPAEHNASISNADMRDGGRTEAGEHPGAADSDPLEEEVRVLLFTADEPMEELSTSDDDTAGGQHDDGAETGDGRTLITVPSCVSSVIDRPEEPLAASENYFHNGIAAYVVVLPHSGDPQAVDAYVVDASCADDGGSPEPDDLLTVESYTR